MPLNTHPPIPSRHRRRPTTTSTTWCCSFKTPPMSPDTHSLNQPKPLTPPHHHHRHPPITDQVTPKHPIINSFPNSPQSTKSGFGLVGRIAPRRILSPGRVSPINSDPIDPVGIESVPPEISSPDPGTTLSPESAHEAEIDARNDNEGSGNGDCGGGIGGVFDVRLNLKGKRGGRLALELNSGVLMENSVVFGDLIGGFRRKNEGGLCRIEVPDVENMGVFRETIELMFEDDIVKRLVKIGVCRAIDVLEVSTNIKFSRCLQSCFQYLEAVPWSDEEEEKIRRLFTKLKFDEASSREILARLDSRDSVGPHQDLPRRLIFSITSCENSKARIELKSLVKGLLCRSSVYETDHIDIKEDLYTVSRRCLSSLVTLFEEASSTTPQSPAAKKESSRPLVESISWEVDNITWVLELLLEHQMAEEFVDMWTDQRELIRMHRLTSSMVRYELSRVTAVLFMAMGTSRLHCRTGSRSELLCSWFGPMLLDFGWLQRCRKGLDIRQLEEAMGQALLTLPLKHQYELFIEWFGCFSRQGTDCPNLNRAFQVWWRRTFLRDWQGLDVESQ